MGINQSYSIQETLEESIQKLRGSITAKTIEIATNAPHLQQATETLHTNLLSEVSEFEGAHVTGTQKLAAERLYESATTEKTEIYTLKIINVINEYKKYLLNSIKHYDDEPTRENEMTLFRTIVYEFDYLQLNDNLRDAITALKTALFSVSKKPFRREQLVSLNIIVDIIKQNIYMSESTLIKILNILDDNFNIAYPVEGLNLIE